MIQKIHSAVQGTPGLGRGGFYYFLYDPDIEFSFCALCRLEVAGIQVLTGLSSMGDRLHQTVMDTIAFPVQKNSPADPSKFCC